MAHKRVGRFLVSILPLLLLPMFLSLTHTLSNPQVTCVINNFQQAKSSPPAIRPQRPESMLGMPMVALPCVESPLEKLSGTQVRGEGR